MAKKKSGNKESCGDFCLFCFFVAQSSAQSTVCSSFIVFSIFVVSVLFFLCTKRDIYLDPKNSILRICVVSYFEVVINNGYLDYHDRQIIFVFVLFRFVCHGMFFWLTLFIYYLH